MFFYFCTYIVYTQLHHTLLIDPQYSSTSMQTVLSSQSKTTRHQNTTIRRKHSTKRRRNTTNNIYTTCHPRVPSNLSTCDILVDADGVWDTELNQQNKSKNIDKFYIMHILVPPDTAANCSCHLFMHWGRTGTRGVYDVKVFPTRSKAKAAFEKKFKLKAGVTWQTRDSSTSKRNKYKYVHKTYTTKRALHIVWEYYLEDDPLGKPDGWYTYDGDMSTLGSAMSNMEDYYARYKTNDWLNVRYVKSGSFTYQIDFDDMTQTNTTSGTTRSIRRIPE